MTTPPIPGRNIMLDRTWTRDEDDTTDISATTVALVAQRLPSLGQARGEQVSVNVVNVAKDNTAGTVTARADWVTLAAGVYAFHWTLAGGLVDEFEETVTINRAMVV